MIPLTRTDTRNKEKDQSILALTVFPLKMIPSVCLPLSDSMMLGIRALWGSYRRLQNSYSPHAS